jgi:hypothetical protein
MYVQSVMEKLHLYSFANVSPRSLEDIFKMSASRSHAKCMTKCISENATALRTLPNLAPFVTLVAARVFSLAVPVMD